MFRHYAIAVLFSFACALTVGRAEAAQRTHVSAASGVDTNTATGCTATAPCRFFQAAMTVTDANGEVVVLDSGGYGAVTITRSVSLIAPTGVYAGISVFPGANGVTVATPGVDVTLRGITINGQGGNNGIKMTAGNKLSVENCVIAKLGTSGIDVNNAAVVRITDTVIRDNAENGVWLQAGAKGTITRAIVSGNGNVAIFVYGANASTITTADVADTTLDGNGYGLNAQSSNASAIVKVSIRDSRVVRNTGYGLAAESDFGAAVSLTASNNIVSNNAYGIAALLSGARVWASGNTVTDNPNFGLYNNSALFESAGNNAVRNSGANVGVITVVATQ